jgi:signal transduction histidine kinase
MDLRVVVHRGLTIAIATLLSLVPVALLVAIFWPKLFRQVAGRELLLFLAAGVAASLLVPLTRDVTARLLDRYVYRTRANYRRTLRDASRALTQVLELRALLTFLTGTVARATEAEGVGVYIDGEVGLAVATGDARHEAPGFALPPAPPPDLLAMLRRTREPVLADEIAADSRETTGPQLKRDLDRLGWALVLPLQWEEALTGLIVLGPKRSGDPYYPEDLDLLMTLTNQAAIAVRNAQLYAQAVLASEYISSIVATIESGVVAVDGRGRIRIFNRAAGELTGLDGAGSRLPPDLADLPAALADALRATLADGNARTEPEIPLPVGSTTTRPVICATSPLRGPAGTVVGAVAVFSDLTPLKELELERQRAERLSYFNMLAARIAHEIKNPLVSIKTFAQLMPRRRDDEAFVASFGRVVDREVTRVDRLVERLTTLSRSSERAPHPVDLRVPINDAVEALQAAMEDKGLAIALALGDVPVVVLGDHGELGQLFMNLLMNAYEATPPGGQLGVELRLAADGSAAVSIADTGPGIQADILGRIFDPFFTTKERGSGLGLAIVAGIAEAHRARLRAENRPGGGALITVEFPVIDHVRSPLLR